jgi:hypothetical protein
LENVTKKNSVIKGAVTSMVLKDSGDISSETLLLKVDELIRKN